MGHTFKDVLDDLTALGEVHDGASALDGQNIVGDDGYKKFQDFRFRFFDWAAKAEWSVFHQWCSSQSQDWGDSYARKLKLANDVITNLHVAISDLRFGKPNGSQEKVASQLTRFKDRVDALVDFANERMQEVGPESYSYGGFKIENPYRFTDPVLHRLNAALDWINSIFKSRGVTPVLNQTLRMVTLSWSDLSASGTYHPDQLRIKLNLDQLPELSGRKSDHFRDFFMEVVLHEIAHHLHLHFLHPDAQKTWDSGWADVAEARELESQGVKVTPEDRGRFFALLQRMKGSIRSALSKLSDLDKGKFKFWLSYTWGMNDTVLASPHQLKLTEYGKRAIAFIKDPDAFRSSLMETYLGVEEGKREFDRFRDTLYSRLGLAGASVNYTVKVPVQLTTKDNASPVQSALDALGIPTEYGKTNYKEDFAETFVYFMLEPDKLSDRALTRMQRALATSNLYGKPIMRMANRVADAYLQKNGASFKSEPDMGMAMSEDQTERFKRITRDLNKARRELLDKLSEAITLLATQGDMRPGSPEEVALELLNEYEDQVKDAPDLNPQGEWMGGGHEPGDVDAHRYRWPRAISDVARTFYRK